MHTLLAIASDSQLLTHHCSNPLTYITQRNSINLKKKRAELYLMLFQTTASEVAQGNILDVRSLDHMVYINHLIAQKTSLLASKLYFNAELCKV